MHLSYYFVKMRDMHCRGNRLVDMLSVFVGVTESDDKSAGLITTWCRSCITRRRPVHVGC